MDLEREFYLAIPLCNLKKDEYIVRVEKESLKKAIKEFVESRNIRECKFSIYHLKKAPKDLEEFANYEYNGEKYFSRLDETIEIENDNVDIDLFSEFLIEVEEIIDDLFQENWDYVTFKPIQRVFLPEKLDELEDVIKRIRENKEKILKQVKEFNERN